MRRLMHLADTENRADGDNGLDDEAAAGSSGSSGTDQIPVEHINLQ